MNWYTGYVTTRCGQPLITRAAVKWILPVFGALFIILDCQTVCGLSEASPKQIALCDPPYLEIDNYNIERAGEKFVELHIRHNIQVR